MRFNREARAWLADGQHQGEGPELTLGDFLQVGSSATTSPATTFCRWGRHLVIDAGRYARLPLGFFLRFFANHGLLEVANRPQWYVIPGGSREYIGPLTAGWQAHIRLACAVQGIRRQADGC